MDRKQQREECLRLVPQITVNAEGWGRTHCPFCVAKVGTEDRRGSLAFYAPYGYFRCFRCGTKLSVKSAAKTDFTTKKAEPFQLRHAPDWFFPLYGGAETSVTFADATRYAESRGYDLALRQAVGIGACATGRYRHRLIIPHKDSFGSWWGFTARTWTPKSQEPYRYPEGMERSRMFNEQALFVETKDPVLVMEGVCDGILYWPDPVTCGGKPTGDQIEIFKRALRPIAIVLDGDAWLEGVMVAHILQLHGVPAGAVRLPPGRDPNDRLKISIEDLRHAARSCIGRHTPTCVEEIDQQRDEEISYV